MNPNINIYEYPSDPSLLPAYRIAVMQAALAGQLVECMTNGGCWTGPYKNSSCMWNWGSFGYRIAKPKARYFRSTSGLFGPKDFYDQQYMYQYYHDGLGMVIGTNGTAGPSYLPLRLAIANTENGVWVEFDGNMEPFRPKPKKEPTTVMGWLLTLPYEYRVLAIRNCDAKIADQSRKDFAQAIDTAFYWHKSPEGHDFWSRVKQSIVYGYPLPPIPEPPKPKKLVPWTCKTCPLGAQIQLGQGFAIIIQSELNGFHAGKFWFAYDSAFRSMSHSTDGGKTWLPCGTYVDE